MDGPTTVQLSASGHVELPPALRERLHWLEAMELEARLTASGLLIQPKQRPRKTRRLEELRGILKHSGRPLSDAELQAPVNLAEDA